MGRNWLNVTFEGLHSFKQPDSLTLTEAVLYLKSELGCLQGAKVKLHVKPDVLPKF